MIPDYETDEIVFDPIETQEVALVSNTHDQIKRALDLQLDFNEARELLEIAADLLYLTGTTAPIGVGSKVLEFIAMTREFLDRTK